MSTNPIQRALISVSDKTLLELLGQGLAAMGVEILSTGGTARALQAIGVPVREVADFTGFPEMLDGRVKTLHPRIHGGLLGVRDNPEHQSQMAAHDLLPIDLVAINLYPFEATVARAGCTLEEAIENIDIGGPAMIRSAAKNHRFVTVLVDPVDYARVLGEMQGNGGRVSAATNAALARKAFARTAAYDGAIANWLTAQDESGKPGLFPEILTLQYRKQQEMRYGENPHQRAAFYRDATPSGCNIACARQLQGKELSFNNINDANGAFELAREFDEPTIAIIKHTNPCGVASDPDLTAAYVRARDADPVSAFGGVIASNRGVDASLAREIAATFVEAVIAPGFSEEARAIFAAKANLRLLESTHPMETARASDDPRAMDLKRVAGGLLVQQADSAPLDAMELRVVSQRHPTEAELSDLLFAWKVAKHVKSNAIVYVKDKSAVGVGAGQMSRVDSSRIAIAKARDVARAKGVEGDPIQGTVMASDAFFPFRDGVDAAAAAGATAVIQPGGSIRDAEVIAAANEHGMAMIFTGVRHFRH
ncbi:MAG: bifunctional phosphoribosylaminoimidazolecarboxamide formyltransferase/IMP cyclohydrolase [Magnetococcales bacterium]|nr:bifunctional phosphoribosylaminoimidazolecarboxamide formyltransferase/IMP cyclohydrolase [Magnetococcales bacterium]